MQLRRGRAAKKVTIQLTPTPPRQPVVRDSVKAVTGGERTSGDMDKTRQRKTRGDVTSKITSAAASTGRKLNAQSNTKMQAAQGTRKQWYARNTHSALKHSVNNSMTLSVHVHSSTCNSNFQLYFEFEAGVAATATFADTHEILIIDRFIVITSSLSHFSIWFYLFFRIVGIWEFDSCLKIAHPCLASSCQRSSASDKLEWKDTRILWLITVRTTTGIT